MDARRESGNEKDAKKRGAAATAASGHFSVLCPKATLTETHYLWAPNPACELQAESWENIPIPVKALVVVGASADTPAVRLSRLATTSAQTNC